MLVFSLGFLGGWSNEAGKKECHGCDKLTMLLPELWIIQDFEIWLWSRDISLAMPYVEEVERKVVAI